MQRLLLASLLGTAAACASNAAGKPATSSTTAQPAGTVCNDESVSPRGTVGERCYTKEQLDNQKRFTSDRKLDPTPRQTYNNN
jgi:hypothetical protein